MTPTDRDTDPQTDETDTDTDVMPELSISSDYMRRLIERLRAVMGREDEVMPDLGGNAGDDARPATLQEIPEDLLREELREEIDALDEDQRHELVALVWTGRGDFDVSEWDQALELAQDRDEGPTSAYLLSHPRVADQLASGLEALGHEHVLQDGRY
ncbi:DUF3775 domain-containing protein [Sulfitobacter sabulilitoris]|uniref:DUF3775 domain-containing protein n=1 Tax=Sulfitobacter sabulilitoris TaxID=2562655 RepID=A0A5S3PBW3_9RHOB|nr:DUF3775 domain-containing protein [Sulfitobacter sabulilitoris]TMM51198.1 DUF3775 domain-containing protein [Sulfitobacter sabulilitoris]